MARAGKPQRYIDQICAAALFDGVERKLMEALLEREDVAVLCFAAGNRITRRGMLGIILSGAAKVSKRSDDSTVIMSRLSAGQMLGAAELFSRGAARLPEMTATERTRVLFIPREALEEAMKQSFILCRNMMEYLTQRVVFLNERIDGFILTSTEDKLLKYLREQSGSGRDELTVNLSALALQLGISRASLYRGLTKLEQNGYIAKQDKTITILRKEE